MGIPHFDRRDLSALAAASRTSLIKLAGNRSGPQILELISRWGSWRTFASRKTNWRRARRAVPNSYRALQNWRKCCFIRSLNLTAADRAVTAAGVTGRAAL